MKTSPSGTSEQDRQAEEAPIYYIKAVWDGRISAKIDGLVSGFSASQRRDVIKGSTIRMQDGQYTVQLKQKPWI